MNEEDRPLRGVPRAELEEIIALHELAVANPPGLGEIVSELREIKQVLAIIARSIMEKMP